MANEFFDKELLRNDSSRASHEMAYLLGKHLLNKFINHPLYTFASVISFNLILKTTLCSPFYSILCTKAKTGVKRSQRDLHSIIRVTHSRAAVVYF